MSLDSIFHNLDHLIRTPEDAETLNRAILNLAFRGRLVPQDQNDEPTETLLHKINLRRGIEGNNLSRWEYKHAGLFDVPTSWQWVTLKDVFDVRDGTHDTPQYVAVGIPFITSKNLDNGRIDYSTAKKNIARGS